MNTSRPRAKYFRQYRKRKKKEAVQVRKKVELLDFVLSRRHVMSPGELVELLGQLDHLFAQRKLV